jgi:hypothetical protein
MVRSLLITVVAVATIGTVSAAGPPGESAARPGRPAPAASQPLPARPGAIKAHLPVRLSPAALDAAASRCARWASRAGFAANGYVGGSLTTAVAVALAESGCNPSACYDDTARRECTPAGTRGSKHSIDRGAWQINSRAWKNVSDACAYRGTCNARAAYRVAADGSYFSPWTVYLINRYSRYLWAAQRAVSALGTGTLTSALPGRCAAAAHQAGAAARLAACGSGAADQQWTSSGGRLRAGALCLTAARAGGAATVRRCTGGQDQAWRPRAGAALYNPATGQCLTARGQSLTGAHCARGQNQGWFRP